MMSASKPVRGVILIGVGCAWAYILLAGEPRLQIGIANGTYSNPCCGTLTLTNGTMSIANQRISYVLEEDKAGPYVLPKVYVGASNDRLVVNSKGYALKLRLDRQVDPHHIELIDDHPGGASYSFARENGS